MPYGDVPPKPNLPQAVFDALHPLDYDSAHQAFTDGSGVFYYLFVQKKQGGNADEAEWFYGTDAEGGVNPRGQIPQATYDVFSGGSFRHGTVTYKGDRYAVRLARDSGGTHIAEAIAA